MEEIFGLEMSLRARESGKFDEEVWRATGGKNRIADPDDAKLLLRDREIEEALGESGGQGGDKVFCRKRKKPLLLVHIIGETGSDKKRKFTGPVVSLSFCLPETKVAPTPRSYQVNTVYRRQLELDLEPDDDEEKMQADDRIG